MTSDQVKAIYERFFRLGGPPTPRHAERFFRRRMTSLRLPGCQLLVDLVQERNPIRVLDLGSGMTSIILRELQRERPDMMVITTDTVPFWLDMTVKELIRDGLSAEHCYEQSIFEEISDDISPTFDLISVDCGNTDYRVSLAPRIANWCAPHGIIVCDDYRLRGYGERMDAALREFGFALTERPETEDEFHQTLGTAEAL